MHVVATDYYIASAKTYGMRLCWILRLSPTLGTANSELSANGQPQTAYSSVKRPWVLIALACLLGLSSTGCSLALRWKRPVQGEVRTPGVEIRAEDGSFQLRGGERFRAPFHTKDCVAWAVHDNWKLALKWRARRVRVTLPGHAEPLHGILSLCTVHPKKAGPAGESYRIEIPAGAAALASGERPIVVVKETDYGVRFKDGFHRFDAWQLWLWRRPFPRVRVRCPTCKPCGSGCGAAPPGT